MLKGFATAWQFLTRINLFKEANFDQESLGKAYRFFPLVGLILGLFLALLGYSASKLFQPLTVAIILVTADILLTGGLHLDGFMDTCDGIYSGRGRDRILEIMKDSRVGSMGVLGALVLLGLKVSFLYELAGTTAFLPGLIVMPLFSRWCMIMVMAVYPSARQQGLGRQFKADMSEDRKSVV